MSPGMSSMQRVLTTLGHQEPDRVPLFLLVTMHGARELGVPLREYFHDPALIAEGQLRLRARYGDDCLYGFLYAPLEVEARGGDVVWVDDGPANSGEPILRRPEDIRDLQPLRVADAAPLGRALTAIELMKERVADEAPIVGVVMSPFSLPVMQMGFDAYIELMYERPELFERLMQVNIESCVDWANAQLAAGATAICYFDPVSASDITPPERYEQWGGAVARQTLARIQGPTATHFASGRCLPIVPEVAETGTAVVGVSAHEELGRLKAACAGRLSVLGNLNGIEMCRWTPEEARAAVRAAIAAAGPGGGFILSDNHGEIPLQVADETLQEIVAATREYGRYPLTEASGG